MHQTKSNLWLLVATGLTCDQGVFCACRGDARKLTDLEEAAQPQRNQCERGGQGLFCESEFKIFHYEELSKSGLNVGKIHVATQGKTPGKVL